MMTCLFYAVAVFVGGEPALNSAEDTANAARALLETAKWVEVKDKEGKTEIRALAAKDEPKAEQAMRDYHDRYQEAVDSYWEHKKQYADAISQLNRQFLDRQESVTADHVNQYFRDRRKLKDLLVAKSPWRAVPKPPYRRVLRYGEWWELRFDEKPPDISNILFHFDTHSIYLYVSAASCGFFTSGPRFLDIFGPPDDSYIRDTRIEVKEQGLVLEMRQLQVYRLGQIHADAAASSLKEAAPDAIVRYERNPSVIVIGVLGFPEEHKAIDRAIAQLRASRKK